MKKSKCILFFLMAVLTLVSCSKEGPQGPAGPQGEQGPKGDQGPQGISGNANVLLYNYDSRTFTGFTNYKLSNISTGQIDSSFILAYYNPVPEVTTAWYPIPGLGASGDYEARYFLYQTSTSPSTYRFAVRLVQAGGTGNYTSPVTWRKTRIFLIKTSEILPGGRKDAPPDFKDYHAVCEYYGIPE